MTCRNEYKPCTNLQNLHVDGPFHSCQITLKSISNRLECLPKHIVLGKLLNGRSTRALKMLDESGQILQLVLDGDQRSVYECFLRDLYTISCDLWLGITQD